jgi:hypothetical protein
MRPETVQVLSVAVKPELVHLTMIVDTEELSDSMEKLNQDIDLILTLVEAILGWGA